MSGAEAPHATARVHLVRFAPSLIVMATALFVARQMGRVFSGREPAGDATPALLLEVRAIAESLAAGDTGLWVHGGNLGYPAGIFEPLFPKLIAASIHLANVDLLVAFKLALTAPLVLLPVTTWIGVRALGLSPWRAALAGAFAGLITSSSRWGVGPSAVFGPGLLDEAWAWAAFPLAAGFGVRFFVDGRGAGRAAAATLVCALCHPIVGASLAFPLVLSLPAAGRRGLARGAFLTLVVVVAGAGQWLPALTNLDAAGIFGPHTDTGDGGVRPARLLQLVTGQAVDAGRAGVITALAALGLVGVAWRATLKRVDVAAATLACAFAVSVFLLVAPYIAYGVFPLGRAVGLLQLSLCVLAACGVVDALAALSQAVGAGPFALVVRGGLGVAMVSLALLLGAGVVRHARDVVRTLDEQPAAARADLDALFAYTAQITPPARIGAVGDVPPGWRTLGGIYAGWAPLWTSVGPAVSSSPNARIASRDEVRRSASLTNTGLIIVPRDTRKTNPRAKPTATFGPMDVYAVNGDTGWFMPVRVDDVFPGDNDEFRERAMRWWHAEELKTGRFVSWQTNPSLPGTGRITVRTERRGPSRFDANLAAETTGPRPVLLKASWSPMWHAYVDGREVPTLRVTPDLVAAEVPPGEHTLSFILRRPFWHGLLWLLAPVVVVLCGRLARRLRLTPAA